MNSKPLAQFTLAMAVGSLSFWSPIVAARFLFGGDWGVLLTFFPAYLGAAAAWVSCAGGLHPASRPFALGLCRRNATRYMDYGPFLDHTGRHRNAWSRIPHARSLELCGTDDGIVSFFCDHDGHLRWVAFCRFVNYYRAPGVLGDALELPPSVQPLHHLWPALNCGPLIARFYGPLSYQGDGPK